MTKYRVAALALAGVLALSATNSASAQWRRHGWVPGVAAGVAAGALIGSAVAARPYYGDYYYGGYGPGFYDAPVAYDYGYAAPAYRYGYSYDWYNCGGSYGQRRMCSWGDTGR